MSLEAWQERTPKKKRRERGKRLRGAKSEPSGEKWRRERGRGESRRRGSNLLLADSYSLGLSNATAVPKGENPFESDTDRKSVV